MNADRYEIEPRPEALGGGWKLHVFGKDPANDAEKKRMQREASDWWPHD